MSTCLDCPKDVKPGRLRCVECNCRRQAQLRRANKARAAAQKKRSNG